MSDDEMMQVLLKAPIAFGLKAQGKLETVREMRLKGAGWAEIAKAIGWNLKTTRDHYMACIEVENAQLREITAKPIKPRISPEFWPKLMKIVGVLLDMDGGPEVLKAWGKLEEDAKGASDGQ